MTPGITIAWPNGKYEEIYQELSNKYGILFIKNFKMMNERFLILRFWRIQIIWKK